MTVRVTLAKLERLGACFESQQRFAELFPLSEYPRGVTVTLERCLQHASDFDWDWAAEKLLPGDRFQNVQAFGVLTQPAVERWCAATAEETHTGLVEADCPECAAQREANHELDRAKARAFAVLVRNPAERTRLPRKEFVGG